MKWYSQAGQDKWAHSLCGDLGTFLDIGCAEPIHYNNTYALEEMGWTGICVDIQRFDYSVRKTPFVQANACNTIPAVDAFLRRNRGSIDYLSLDTDDATFCCMERLIPFFKFKCITVEHDSYRVGPNLKNTIFKFLTTFGYERRCDDICAPELPPAPWSGKPFEDWYVLKGA